MNRSANTDKPAFNPYGTGEWLPDISIELYLYFFPKTKPDNHEPFSPYQISL